MDKKLPDQLFFLDVMFIKLCRYSNNFVLALVLICRCLNTSNVGVFVFTGLDYWTGLLD